MKSIAKFEFIDEVLVKIEQTLRLDVLGCLINQCCF